jgi:hypothetical protein
MIRSVPNVEENHRYPDSGSAYRDSNSRGGVERISRGTVGNEVMKLRSGGTENS